MLYKSTLPQKTFCPEQVRFINRRFSRNTLSHRTVPIPIKYQLNYIEGAYPETIKLTPTTREALQSDALQIILYPNVSKEVLRYVMEYLKRREVW